MLHNARLYDRMGCDLLALDLVRNWEFMLQPQTKMFRNIGELGGPGHADVRGLLRRRSSLVVADLPVGVPSELRSGMGLGTHQPPPSVFEEPEGNSLLDSFGF